MAVAFKPQLHTFDRPRVLWFILLCITRVIHDPGNGIGWDGYLWVSVSIEHLWALMIMIPTSTGNCHIYTYRWHMANVLRYKWQLCQSDNYTSDHGTCGFQLMLIAMFGEHTAT